MSKMLEIILKANIDYLCELYQYANKKYFIAYVDSNEKDICYYKELINAISKELRNRNYWRK